MRHITSGTLVLTMALVLASGPAQAQFGQNKIAYSKFDWSVYQSPHFDIHYYAEEEPYLEDIVSYAESAYLRISNSLDHELRFRVPLVIYKTHQEFRQTNITLAELPEGVGAFAEPVQNRMVLPIDLPPEELYALISHELVHIFQYSIFFEGYLGRAIRSNPPTWFIEGMASYLADDEDNFDRMAIRDAVVNNFLPPIRAMSGLSFLAYRYGHAVFDFIEQEHGKEGFRNFVYEFRKVLMSGNVEKAVKESFGYDQAEFDRRFNRYLRKKYFPVLLEKKAPDDYGKQIGLKRGGIQPIPTFSPTISPSGELIAAFSLPKQEIDLLVLSADDGSKVRNLTKGWTNQYEYLVTEVFSGRRDLSWSPSGDEVATFVRIENRRVLFVFNALTGKIVRKLPLGDHYEATSPAFSPDGRRVAFEANLRGTVDLFEIELDSGTIRNLTRDEFFDTNPWYSTDGKSLIYNRRIGEHWKIFSVDLSDPSRKTQITYGPHSDIQPAYSRDGNTIYFSSDRDPNGVFNIYALDLGTGEILQYTDVVGGCFAPVEMAPRDEEPYLAFAAFFTGSFKLYRMPLRQPERRVDVSERLDQPVEATPFEAPVRLSLDEEKSRPYKLRWDIEAPSITLGVADDGTFLTNSAIAFTDLLGDHRINIQVSSVSDFSNTYVSYMNLKKRTNWGAAIYDYRDYFLTGTSAGVDRDQVLRNTGASFMVQHPLSRYYRLDANVGYLDRSQDFLVAVTPNGFPLFERINESFATATVGITGDTTRYQNFGPFQGKRFRFNVLYGANVGGDTEGDILQYNLDFRAYKQVTARSLLAFRAASVYNDGDRETYYTLGGINQLRGYDYRDFFGSRIAWMNLEFRFPLADSLRFPFGGGIGPIRGFIFLDAGAAWFGDDTWWDPDLFIVRTDQLTGEPIPFDFWDSENNRLQDARASYGVGFQFFFLGGLQFNWSWAKRLPYTRYAFDEEIGNLVPIEADTGSRRMDFYIVFDW